MNKPTNIVVKYQYNYNYAFLKIGYVWITFKLDTHTYRPIKCTF